MKKTEWREVYPMDYYSNTGGEWTNYHHKQSNFSQFIKKPYLIPQLGTKKPRKNLVVQYEAAAK